MKVAELKQALLAHNLSATGKKAALLERLERARATAAQQQAQPEAGPATPAAVKQPDGAATAAPQQPATTAIQQESASAADNGTRQADLSQQQASPTAEAASSAAAPGKLHMVALVVAVARPDMS